MKYKDYISVNENFQYSVNLQFDINNISKIKEYIPTKDGCELLAQFFNSVLSSKNRATTLIGQYGKWKSHLLLVLITLLNNYNSEDKTELNSLLSSVYQLCDKAVSKGILHKNTAARKKSRLVLAVKKLAK